MRKLGHIYCPTGEWSHASTPTVQHLGGDFYRVYFASRDRQNRGHIFSLDLDINRPTYPLNNVRGPLIGPGRKGTFDDCGLSPACFSGGVLYYLGWSLTKSAPFHNAIGQLIVEDGLRRIDEVPILDRSYADPISVAYPWVIDGELMYYSSNLSWGETDEDMAFVLRSADNGWYRWSPNSGDVIPLHPGERAIVRPTVLHGRMWYAIKTDKYRIGNAKWSDGWLRYDDCPLQPSEGFDSEEVTYPCVFQHKDKVYMLYNGNGYGKTGFGIAVED